MTEPLDDAIRNYVPPGGYDYVLLRDAAGRVVRVVPAMEEQARDYLAKFEERLEVGYTDPNPEVTAAIERIDRELEATEQLRNSVTCGTCGRTGFHTHFTEETL